MSITGILPANGQGGRDGSARHGHSVVDVIDVEVEVEYRVTFRVQEIVAMSLHPFLQIIGDPFDRIVAGYERNVIVGAVGPDVGEPTRIAECVSHVEPGVGHGQGAQAEAVIRTRVRPREPVGDRVGGVCDVPMGGNGDGVGRRAML